MHESPIGQYTLMNIWRNWKAKRSEFTQNNRHRSVVSCCTFLAIVYLRIKIIYWRFHPLFKCTKEIYKVSKLSISSSYFVSGRCGASSWLWRPFANLNSTELDCNDRINEFWLGAAPKNIDPSSSVCLRVQLNSECVLLSTKCLVKLVVSAAPFR